MIVAVVAILLAVYLFRSLQWRGAVKPTRTPKGARAERSTSAGKAESPEPTDLTPIGEADRLAAAGACEAAIHLLLLSAYDTMRRVGQRFPRALTSRELVGAIQLAEDREAALRALVRAVEISHFGGRPAGKSEYEHCRDNFLRLTRARSEEGA
jgi:hypothetical protein